MAEKSELILKVEYADYTQNYDKMISALKQLVKLDPRLTVELISYLSIAYEAIATQKGNYLNELLTNSPNSHHEIRKARNDYKNLCKEFIFMINLQLLPNAESRYHDIMLYRLLGEYNYNLVNVEEEDVRGEYIQAANNGFKKGYEMTKLHLSRPNPLRLAFASKFANFKYNILREIDTALDILEEEYNATLPLMSSLTGEALKSVSAYIEEIEYDMKRWLEERYDSLCEKLTET